MTSDSDPIKVLLQAAADNNITGLSQKLSKTRTRTQRLSLILACKLSNINYVKEMKRLEPDLAYIKGNTRNGYTVLHDLIIDGEVQVLVIEALIKDLPQLCMEADYEGITPFHMAAKQGRKDILKVLIRECGSQSHSLVIDALFRVNILHQSALHLALEHDQIGCFDVLAKELLKGDDDQQSRSLRLFNLKDHEGNTVLHIAIARKQSLISGYLLENNPKGRPLIEADIKNNLGLKALQIHDMNSPACDHMWIRQLLIRADQTNVVASMAICHNNNNSDTSTMTLLTAKTLIITAMTIFATVITGSLFSYRDIYKTASQQSVPPNANLRNITLLPAGFFYLTLATSAFLLCMCTALVQLWSINSRYWSTFGRPIVLFLFIVMLSLFGLMVKELVPDFSVAAFGAQRISSLCLLGLYVAALLLSFFTIVFFVAFLLRFLKSLFSCKAFG